MLWRFILIFTAIPLLELALLIEIGRRIGTLSTIILILVTAMLGAILVKYEGWNILRRIREELNQGMLPADEVFNGFLILAGGLLLITPGLLTDLAGFCLVLPFTRKGIKSWLKKRLLRRMERGRISFYWYR